MAERPLADMLIGNLQTMDGGTLRQEWIKTFGKPPPDTLSIGFIRKVLAHEVQCRRVGGIAANHRRLLRSLAAGKAVPEQLPGHLTVGAHLVREWNGRTHRVEVVEEGYRFDGRVYRSLTAIAKRITGTNWSGPRFFGLTARTKA